MSIAFGSSFTQKTYTWTNWKVIQITKSGNYQYDSDGNIYTVYFYDGSEVHLCTIWQGIVPDGVVNGGYSQVQNDSDKSDFETNFKPNANARISDNISQRTVLNNVTVTAGSSQILSGISVRQVNLFINCTQAFTGVAPGIQFTITEVDPGDQSTAIGTTVTGASITSGPNTQELSLNLTTSSTIKVSWIIVGSSSPTFPGVYVTLVSKPTTTISGVDVNGVERILRPDTSGRLLVSGSNAISTPVTVDPVIVGGTNVGGVAGYLQLSSDNSAIVSQGTNTQPVFINGTITASGISNVVGLGVPMVNLFINIKNAPTGTNPTLVFSMYEVDPGDKATALGTSVTGIPLSKIGTQILSLPLTTSGVVQVSWTISGLSPSFTGVYVTALMKDANIVGGPNTEGTTATGNPVSIGGIDQLGLIQAITAKSVNGMPSLLIHDELTNNKLDEIILLLRDIRDRKILGE